MSDDFARAALGLFAAVAPLGGVSAFAALTAAMTARRGIAVAVASGLAALALLTATIAGGDAFLDWLDVSPESFQLAAGLAMLPLAFRLLWRGDTFAIAPDGPLPDVAAWRAALVPLTTPLVAGPASLVAALSYGTREGEGTALGAAAAVVAITAAIFAAGPWLTAHLRERELRTLGRLSGALLVVVAVELMIDGVRSV